MCHSTTLMCHCEERSDVAISGRKLRFRRWLSRDSTGYGEIATAPLGPRNDKPLVFTILTAVRLLRRCSAGRGMPRTYGGCIMLYYLKKPFLTVSKISSAFLPQVSSIFRQ